jgi:uncharacterized protein involved in exopolysaccharide biosynthesis
MDKRRSKPRYLTSKRAHYETMQALMHMHKHQLEILERMKDIMTAFDDLTREVQETKDAVGQALVKMQELIDEIKANPSNAAAVTAAVQQLDELQTQIAAVINPPAP